MSQLLYKAWLEIRVRFLAGLAGVAIICIHNIEPHAGPQFGIYDYGWYLWRNLYDEGLQQIWALFAVVLAFGGLIQEKTNGTASFSLGLPVSRKRWLFTRLTVVLAESAALSLFAALIIVIGSSAIHQTFLPSQVFLHAALIVAAGVFLIAFGNLCCTLFPGNYLSLLVTVVVIGAPYLWIQLQMQRMRLYEAFCAAHPCRKPSGFLSWMPYLAYLDIPHVMGGPWQLNWATIPWISLAVLWTLTAIVLGVTVAYGDRLDY